MVKKYLITAIVFWESDWLWVYFSEKLQNISSMI